MSSQIAGDVASELDVSELIMQHLKSKSFAATAKAFEEELRIIATKSTEEQHAVDLFASKLEYKLGVRDKMQGARPKIAPLDMTPPHSLKAASVPSREEVRMPASPGSAFKRTRAKLFNLTSCNSASEASRLRRRHGDGDVLSRVVFHDPPPMSPFAGARFAL